MAINIVEAIEKIGTSLQKINLNTQEVKKPERHYL